MPEGLKQPKMASREAHDALYKGGLLTSCSISEAQIDLLLLNIDSRSNFYQRDLQILLCVGLEMADDTGI